MIRCDCKDLNLVIILFWWKNIRCSKAFLFLHLFKYTGVIPCCIFANLDEYVIFVHSGVHILMLLIIKPHRTQIQWLAATYCWFNSIKLHSKSGTWEHICKMVYILYTIFHQPPLSSLVQLQAWSKVVSPVYIFPCLIMDPLLPGCLRANPQG